MENSTSPKLPELVRDTELDTAFRDGYTIHMFRDTPVRASKPREEFWKREKRIGKGGFGVIWLERHVDGLKSSSPNYRAVKEIALAGRSSIVDYAHELDALAKFSQKKYSGSFIESYGWFKGTDCLLVSLEYFPLGDLKVYTTESGTLPEMEVQEIVFQITQGLQKMHNEGFAHRDLTPANIFVKSRPPNDWWIKLGDFGLSKRIDEHLGFSTLKGTPGFIAPELYEHSNRDRSKMRQTLDAFPLDMLPAADIWSLGEIAHQLLTSKPVFCDLLSLGRYCDGRREFPVCYLEEVEASTGAVDFIKLAMLANYRERVTANAALRHEWMQEQDAPISLPSVDLKGQPEIDPNPVSNSQETVEYINWTTTSLSAGQMQQLNLNSTGEVQQPAADLQLETGCKMDDQTSEILATNPDHSSSTVNSSMGNLPISSESLLTRSSSGELRLQPLASIDNPTPHQAEETAVVSPDSERNMTEYSIYHRKNVILYLFKNKTIRDQGSLTDTFRIAKLEHSKGRVNSLTFSPDAARLALVSRSGGITILNTQILSFIPAMENTSKSLLRNDVDCVAFSHDSQWVAAASSDKIIRVSDAETGRLVQILTGHTDTVYAMQFSRDSVELVSASQDNTVRVWSWKSGKAIEKKTLVFSRRFPVMWAAFQTAFPERRILSVDQYGMGSIWSLQSDTWQIVGKKDLGNVETITMSDDSKHIATASTTSIRIWRATSNNLRKIRKIKVQGGSFAEQFCSISFINDSAMIAGLSNDGTIKIWSTKSGLMVTDLRRHKLDRGFLTTSSNNDWLAASSSDKTVTLWNTKKLAILEAIQENIDNAAFVTSSPDESMAAAIPAALLRTSLTDQSSSSRVKIGQTHVQRPMILIFDVKTGMLCDFLEIPNMPIVNMLFSPDSKELASISTDSIIRIWNLATGVCISSLISPAEADAFIQYAVFSPDWCHLAVAEESKTSCRIRLWSVAEKIAKRFLGPYDKGINAMAFSADSQLLATAFTGQLLRIHKVSTGDLASEHRGDEPHEGLKNQPARHGLKLFATNDPYASPFFEELQKIRCAQNPPKFLQFSPDAQKIALFHGDNRLEFWDLTTDQRDTYYGQMLPISAMPVLSSDWKQIFTASINGSIDIWDISTNKVSSTLKGNLSPVVKLILGSESQTLVGVSNRGISIWDLKTKEKTDRKNSTGVFSNRELLFLQNLNRFMTLTDDRVVSLWDCKMRPKLAEVRYHM